MNAVWRPPLRYLGSKWRLAPWVIEQLPPHEFYLEPYAGGFSVGLRKHRVRTEIYNDLDGELVNLFQVLRSDEAGELIRQIYLTPYARSEFIEANRPCSDPIERARRLIIRSHMGYGTRSTRTDRPAGFRCDGTTGTTRVAGEWAELPGALQAIVDRLRGVSIQNRPALELIRYWDTPRTLIYLDPPYVPETRSDKSKQAEIYHSYTHEMSEADHVELLETIRRASSMVAISGYPCPLYDDLLDGWERRQTQARSHRNSKRTEVLWLNPAAVDAIGGRLPFQTFRDTPGASGTAREAPGAASSGAAKSGKASAPHSPGRKL